MLLVGLFAVLSMILFILWIINYRNGFLYKGNKRFTLLLLAVMGLSEIVIIGSLIGIWLATH